MKAAPPTSTQRPTWAEVNLDAVAHNVGALRGACPAGTRVMAVVKSDAYGHGMVPVARAAMAGGADALGVATTDEGLALRETAGFATTSILVMGPSLPAEAMALQAAGLAFSVGSVALLEHHIAVARRRGVTPRIHFQIDTGMGRDGVHHDDLAFLNVLRREGIALEGLWTHLAVSDSFADEHMEFTREQLRRFAVVSAAAASAGQRPLLHAANSGAILRHASYTALDMVRPGISLYGCDPAGPVQPPVPLRAVLSVKSALVAVKWMDPGETVSYGRTYTVATRRRIGIVPAGYGDGYIRSLSGKWKVLVRGVEVPICGRVCMDQFMVDLDAAPAAEIGDEVVLVGEQRGRRITLEQVADAAGTIPWELGCILTRRVPRVYTGALAS